MATLSVCRPTLNCTVMFSIPYCGHLQCWYHESWARKLFYGPPINTVTARRDGEVLSFCPSLRALLLLVDRSSLTNALIIKRRNGKYIARHSFSTFSLPFHFYSVAYLPTSDNQLCHHEFRCRMSSPQTYTNIIWHVAWSAIHQQDIRNTTPTYDFGEKLYW